MMPTTRLVTAITLLCLIPLQGASAAAYKWVDDKGETHYSQTPPTATRVEVIKTPSSPSTSAAPPIEKSTPAPEPESGATGNADSNTAAKAEDAAIRAKNCTIARSNLDALDSAAEVTIKDANGLLHSLTPEERKSRRDEAEKHIKEFCKE